MNFLRLHTLLFILVLPVIFLTGCSDLIAPLEPCERYYTANISVMNSASWTYYDIIIDGAEVASSLAPGRYVNLEVAAGQHRIEFVFSNSPYLACNTIYPNLAICESTTYYCTRDL